MSNKKILIVDDEPINIQLVENILKDKDYDLVSADNGLDAMVMIKEEKPDLIVLDIMIPEINGYDICHQLRFNSEYDQIPILLYTCRDQELMAEIGSRVNIDYIQKPIDERVFVEKVENLLSVQEEQSDQ